MQAIPGSNKNSTASVPDPSLDHGAFHLDGKSKKMTILISGKGNSEEQPIEKFIGLRVHRCFYEGCITPTPPVPPSSRPNVTRFWGKIEDWNGRNMKLKLHYIHSIQKLY